MVEMKSVITTIWGCVIQVSENKPTTIEKVQKFQMNSNSHTVFLSLETLSFYNWNSATTNKLVSFFTEWLKHVYISSKIITHIFNQQLTEIN